MGEYSKCTQILKYVYSTVATGKTNMLKYGGRYFYEWKSIIQWQSTCSACTVSQIQLVSPAQAKEEANFVLRVITKRTEKKTANIMLPLYKYIVHYIQIQGTVLDTTPLIF